MEHEWIPDDPEGEYGVVDLSASWHVASLVCFVAALGACFLAMAVPRGVLPVPRSLVPGLLVLLLATVGLLCEIAGLRKEQTKRTARVGIFLNATVLAIGLLGVGAYFYIRSR
jgi:heme/copper-type cytochrome/quinol oxidase subunit 3